MNTALESSSNGKSTLVNTPSAKPLRRSRSGVQDEGLSGARFFLAKTDMDGKSLELGRELSTEGEARVEALKNGVTYYSLQEWRPVPDLAGRNPELKRELVKRQAEEHEQK